MFYSIYNFFISLPFVFTLGFYAVTLTILFIISLAKNITRIKQIERVEQIKVKRQYFVILAFCTSCLLFKELELKLVVGGVCFLYCYSMIINYLQNKIQSSYLRKWNKREEKVNYFNKDNGVIERSKKILSTIKVAPLPSTPEKKVDDKLNFVHVKSILKKLQNYSLNQTEKKQVEDLSFAMYLLENGGNGEEEKIKLNDGLNSLLKIMAKYSV